jgi:hypothetical protein
MKRVIIWALLGAFAATFSVLLGLYLAVLVRTPIRVVSVRVVTEYDLLNVSAEVGYLKLSFSTFADVECRPRVLPVGGRLPGNFDLWSLGLTTLSGSGATRLKIFSSESFCLLPVLINITMNNLKVLYSLWRLDIKRSIVEWPQMLREVLFLASFSLLARQSSKAIISLRDLALFHLHVISLQPAQVVDEPTRLSGPRERVP